MLSSNCTLRSSTPLSLQLLAYGLIVALTAACAGPQPSPAPLPTTTAEPLNDPQNPSDVLADTDEPPQPEWLLSDAQLIIHIGKTGRLARLGHNHLVSASDLQGSAWFDATNSLNAQVSLEVNALQVDNLDLRKSFREQPGGEWLDIYKSTPTAKNIADTRKNMLGSRVLDAQHYPTLRVQAVAADAAAEFEAANAGSLNASIEITLKAQRSNTPVTLHWQRLAAGSIAWQARFEVTHQSLGLDPFSALGGALAVADLLRIEVSGVLVRSGNVQINATNVRHEERTQYSTRF